MQARPINATPAEPVIAPDESVLLAGPVLDAIARLLARHVIMEITTKSPCQEPLP